MELAALLVRYILIVNVIWTYFGHSLFTGGTMIGFDAAGHIAEETKHAK